MKRARQVGAGQRNRSPPSGIIIIACCALVSRRRSISVVIINNNSQMKCAPDERADFVFVNLLPVHLAGVRVEMAPSSRELSAPAAGERGETISPDGISPTRVVAVAHHSSCRPDTGRLLRGALNSHQARLGPICNVLFNHGDGGEKRPR